jgi:hypothetical protein
LWRTVVSVERAVEDAANFRRILEHDANVLALFRGQVSCQPIDQDISELMDAGESIP